MTSQHNDEEVAGKIQSLLFIYGEAISKTRLKKLLEISSEQIDAAVTVLRGNLKEHSLALTLIEDNKRLQLATKPELSGLLESVMKSEMGEQLSKAALETLSIICYSAPISRADIDYIRGVNSSFILKNLLIRGLVERKSNPKHKGSFIYSPSFQLIKHLGIEQVSQLPEYEKFSALARGLSQENQSQSNGETSK